MRKIIASVLCLLLVSQLAYSQGSAINIFVPNVGNKPVQGDANGTQFVTERYPAAYQYGDPVTVIGALAVAQSAGNQTSPLTPVTPYTVGNIYGWKWAEVTVTGGVAASPWSIKFLGSSDANTWHYLMNSYSTTIEQNIDTLKVNMHGATPSGNPIAFPIATGNGFPIVDKYIGAVCVNDSTAGGTLTFTVKIYGRMQ